jgi:Rod binding domain-containing protein
VIGRVEAAPPSPPDPVKVKDAARQFEALLLGQILRTMREAATGEGGDALLEVAEQNLAQAMAAQGGIGLASLVVEGLGKAATRPSEPTPSTHRAAST